jgi:hypothetical protein
MIMIMTLNTDGATVNVRIGVCQRSCRIIFGEGSPAADMAARAASLTMNNIDGSDENGIVADTAENSIQNLKRLNHSRQAAEEKCKS